MLFLSLLIAGRNKKNIKPNIRNTIELKSIINYFFLVLICKTTKLFLKNITSIFLIF
jgi:hypothetical protein